MNLISDPIASSTGGDIKATIEIRRAVADLMQIKDVIKDAKQRQLELEEVVKLFMGENPVLTGKDDKILCIWKNIKPSKRFDSSLFKEEHKELYTQYLTEAVEQRRFIVK